MKREPSIHITRSVFIKLTQELGIKLSKPNIDKLMKAAREHSLDNRTMIAKANQTRQIRNASGSIGDANMVAQLIYSIRVRLKHIGVTKIKQTDLAWGQIRELVPTLNQFCKNYSLNKREGYIAFLEIGFELLNKAKRKNYNYCASWMLKQATYIDEVYQSKQAIKNDPYPKNTQELVDLYQTKSAEMTGIYSESILRDTSEYIHFLRARELADSLGIDYETFIDAQFASLAFCNGIPRINDLDTDKAEQRVAQYVAKQGIQIHRTNLAESTWNQFKQ